jgi:capsular polysaccharide export protein
MRLFMYSIGLWFQRRPKRILRLAGWRVAPGWPRAGGSIGVWGRKRSALRGMRIARAKGLPLVTIEDAFLRSVRTGREGETGLGVVADRQGISFDADGKSDLFDLIGQADSFDRKVMSEARLQLAKMRYRRLSKYNAFDDDLSGLPKKFVLVLDQASKDASIALGGATDTDFRKMLEAAQQENPGKTVLIKAHPETIAGKRTGFLAKDATSGNIVYWSRRTNPWALFERAEAVYCVTSQTGLEAIFAGHRPVVFGRPFYAGWGLSDDRNPNQVLKGSRTAEQIFAAAYLKYPIWYDPFRDCLTSVGRVLDILQAQSRHWSATRRGLIFCGVSYWKQGFIAKYLGMVGRPAIFAGSAKSAIERAEALDSDVAVWASQEGEKLSAQCAKAGRALWRVEDGFIRSIGLGAHKIRPVSLVLDDMSIHYDPSRPSRLEQLIASSSDLPDFEIARATDLRARFVRQNLSKYNLGGPPCAVPDAGGRKRVLVVGQVEDDASVMKGAGRIARNSELVKAARYHFRDAFLIWKPHPDVEAGLRQSAGLGDALSLVDHVAKESDIAQLLPQVDHVCTMTSLAGFEALLHGKSVTCFGTPFYSGWGLTEDLGVVPRRRKAKPSLDGLVHAALIAYPYYWDPVTRMPCPVEVVLERFEEMAKATGQPSWFVRAKDWRRRAVRTGMRKL